MYTIINIITGQETTHPVFPDDLCLTLRLAEDMVLDSEWPISLVVKDQYGRERWFGDNAELYI